LTEGWANDCRGAEVLLLGLPDADKNHNSGRIRNALPERKITPCIFSRTNRQKLIACDVELYKQRNLVESMFRGFKD